MVHYAFIGWILIGIIITYTEYSDKTKIEIVDLEDLLIPLYWIIGGIIFAVQFAWGWGSIWAGIVGGAGGIGSWLWNSLKGIGQWLYNGLQWIYDGLSCIGSTIYNALSNTGSWLLNSLSGLDSWIWNGLSWLGSQLYKIPSRLYRNGETHSQDQSLPFFSRTQYLEKISRAFVQPIQREKNRDPNIENKETISFD